MDLSKSLNMDDDDDGDGGDDDDDGDEMHSVKLYRVSLGEQQHLSAEFICRKLGDWLHICVCHFRSLSRFIFKIFSYMFSVFISE